MNPIPPTAADAYRAMLAEQTYASLVEAKLTFTDLKKPVQDSLLKIFQMYDNTSLSQNQKDGLAAVFKYGLEFSDFTQHQSVRQGY